MTSVSMQLSVFRLPIIGVRYSTMSKYNNRQSFIGDNVDDILENRVVGVVGLGGGGSQIVQQLAHIGFKQYVLCDFDVIEETNLNRLVGATIDDVDHGVSKMSIAVRLIRGLQPSAVIHKVTKRFQDDSEALKRCDIIFGCLDGFLNREQLEKLARSAFIPYIDIGMDVRRPEHEPPRMSGQVIASVPGKPCMRCYSFLTDDTLAEEARKYGDTGIRPQVIWPNGILASTAIHIGLNLLTNWTRAAEQQTLYYVYDGNKGEIKPHLFLERQLNKPCIHYLKEHAGDRTL
jgi:molybdopterin-synthase adenylyltransferase